MNLKNSDTVVAILRNIPPFLHTFYLIVSNSRWAPVPCACLTAVLTADQIQYISCWGNIFAYLVHVVQSLNLAYVACLLWLLFCTNCSTYPIPLLFCYFAFLSSFCPNVGTMVILWPTWRGFWIWCLMMWWQHLWSSSQMTSYWIQKRYAVLGYTFCMCSDFERGSPDRLCDFGQDEVTLYLFPSCC